MDRLTIFRKVNQALDAFYNVDSFLVEQGLSERCLQHRIAVHLENEGFPSYFIDCEYNKSHLNEHTDTKVVSSPHGNYIDIIVGRRSGNFEDDLACFEIKRWSNNRNRQNDRDKLSILTAGDSFDYDYGFYLILGPSRRDVEIEYYQNGSLQNTSRDGYLN